LGKDLYQAKEGLVSRKMIWIGVVLVSLLSVGTAQTHAQGPGSKDSDPHWHVTYWNNTSLSGTPVLEETAEYLGFDWGYGSPHPLVRVDQFSARCSRYLDLEEGTWRFSAKSDDGIRVYVDDRLIIDQWNDHPAQTATYDLALEAGHHHVVVEYYENTGVALVGLAWSSLPAGSGTWVGNYYANRWLGGSPVMFRVDDQISFDWGYGAPSAQLPNDGFSVCWTRLAHLKGGLYRFTTTTDDGVRLWVNDHLLIDKWQDQAASSYSGTIHVSGDVPIRMEYYENGGVASARLTWTRLDDTPIPAPDEVVVDDDDPGFVKGGLATAWQREDAGYGGRLTWTRNNDRVRPNYNWGRWYPELSPGRYEVYVHIPVERSSTSNARYWVAHYGGYTLRKVNQSANRGQWVSLGTYRFTGTRRDYVSLADVTYESYLQRQIAWDAVKWVSR
jgi:hypothetical protein